MTQVNKADKACPCSSGQNYASCCMPYLSGEKNASTAEELMRSRYCAYVHEQVEYLLATWHESSRPASLDLNRERPDRWLGLKIVNKDAGQKNDTQGSVEFIAKYKLQGKAYRMHEKSRFLQENGKWYYLDGEMIE